MDEDSMVDGREDIGDKTATQDNKDPEINKDTEMMDDGPHQTDHKSTEIPNMTNQKVVKKLRFDMVTPMGSPGNTGDTCAVDNGCEKESEKAIQTVNFDNNQDQQNPCTSDKDGCEMSDEHLNMCKGKKKKKKQNISPNAAPSATVAEKREGDACGQEQINSFNSSIKPAKAPNVAAGLEKKEGCDSGENTMVEKDDAGMEQSNSSNGATVLSTDPTKDPDERDGLEKTEPCDRGENRKAHKVKEAKRPEMLGIL